MVYNYRCNCPSCGQQGELVYKMGEAPARVECPRCKQITYVRVFSPTMSVWKTTRGV